MACQSGPPAGGQSKGREAYPKILLLGLAARPDELPDELRRESTDFNFVPARNPEVETGRGSD